MDKENIKGLLNLSIDKLGNTHPITVFISQCLDEIIVKEQKELQ